MWELPVNKLSELLQDGWQWMDLQNRRFHRSFGLYTYTDVVGVTVFAGAKEDEGQPS